MIVQAITTWWATVQMVGPACPALLQRQNASTRHGPMNVVETTSTWYLKEASAQRSVPRAILQDLGLKWRKTRRWLVAPVKNVLAAAAGANLNPNAWNAQEVNIWIQPPLCVPWSARVTTSWLARVKKAELARHVLTTLLSAGMPLMLWSVVGISNTWFLRVGVVLQAVWTDTILAQALLWRWVVHWWVGLASDV